jgi:hypothetical protein
MVLGWDIVVYGCNTCMIECTQLNLGFSTVGQPHTMDNVGLVRVYGCNIRVRFRVYGLGL